jgi:hypothetical protein
LVVNWSLLKDEKDKNAAERIGDKGKRFRGNIAGDTPAPVPSRNRGFFMKKRGTAR